MSDSNVLSTLCQRWNDAAGSGALHSTVVDNADEPTIRLDQAGDVRLDLSGVPAALTLQLNTTRSHVLTLHNLADDALIKIQVTPSTVEADIKLEVSVGGTVATYGPPEPQTRTFLETDIDCRARIVHHEGILIIQDNTLPNRLRMTIHGGALYLGGEWDDVTLRGTASVRQVNARASINRLKVVGPCGLLLTDEDPPDIYSIVGERLGEMPSRLEFRVSGHNQPKNIRTHRLHDIELESPNGQVVVRSTANVRNLVLAGNVSVLFSPGATADGVVGRVDGGIPGLSAGQNSVLTGLSGEFVLGMVQGASVEGDIDGFLISGVDPSRFGASVGSSDAISESILRGFRTPRGLTGRQLLTHLEPAFQLEPSKRELPGSDMDLPAALRPRRPVRGWLAGIFMGAPPPDYASSTLHHDAELMRELHRLVKLRGAPGASRTKVGWCAYRLRHATTTGTTERLALTCYRALGYGERPLPSLMTWLVFSVVAAATVLGWNPDVSWEGVWTLARETVTQASGPLAAVMRSGTSSLSHEWEYVFRALVAVPLITAALAVRNYVKGGD